VCNIRLALIQGDNVVILRINIDIVQQYGLSQKEKTGKEKKDHKRV
jgi:hypothetical protein